jgi:hypothetical protein
MTSEQILSANPLVLEQREREQYFEDGFLAVPGYIGAAWLDRLRAVVAAKIEESRPLTASDDQFDLAPDHSAEKPNIRRLRKAVDQHTELWTFAKDPAVVDLCADLLGPDVRFYTQVSELPRRFSASPRVRSAYGLRASLQERQPRYLRRRGGSRQTRAGGERDEGRIDLHSIFSARDYPQ